MIPMSSITSSDFHMLIVDQIVLPWAYIILETVGNSLFRNEGGYLAFMSIVQVVPTVYTDISGHTIQTNQVSKPSNVV